MSFDEIKTHIPDLQLKFVDELYDTYVVEVKLGGHVFQVSCFNEVDFDGVWLDSVTCINDSGGDFYDCGLSDFIDEHYDDERISELLIKAIEVCAEEGKMEETVEAYLQVYEKLHVERNFKDGVAGCGYFNNVSLIRYDEIDGNKVVIVAADYSLPRVKDSLKKYRIFDTCKEYEDWDEEQQGDGCARPRVDFGDFNLAIRMFESLDREISCE